MTYDHTPTRDIPVRDIRTGHIVKQTIRKATPNKPARVQYHEVQRVTEFGGGGAFQINFPHGFSWALAGQDTVTILDCGDTTRITPHNIMAYATYADHRDEPDLTSTDRATLKEKLQRARDDLYFYIPTADRPRADQLTSAYRREAAIRGEQAWAAAEAGNTHDAAAAARAQHAKVAAIIAQLQNLEFRHHSALTQPPT